MVEEGLFERFPMRAVYGMHNWPLQPFGTFATRVGPLMGAFDIFEIIATGKGAHAAMPNTGKDPMLFDGTRHQRAADDRRAEPASARSGRRQRHSGPRRRHLERDSARGRRCAAPCAASTSAVQDLIERRMRTIVAGIARDVRNDRDCPATSAAIRRRSMPRRRRSTAIAAAGAVVGAANVDAEPMPNMGSEDFAFMLQAKPGCYVWLGTGRGPDTPQRAQPVLRFQPTTLPIGASYWATLVAQQLAA